MFLLIFYDHICSDFGCAGTLNYIMGDIVLAFDIYGTLLSFETVTHELKRFLDNDKIRARTVAQTWRRYQLEYTFRLNSMGRFESRPGCYYAG